MEMTQEELDERVALLKKFRAVLEQQRAKFKEYLVVLEKQQDSITEENPDKLFAHTQLEQQVVRNIANLQKVIVPMSRMYDALNHNPASPESASITRIQKDLDELQHKVLKQNEINRDLLRIHLEQIKTQLDNFKNPYKNSRSVYAQSRPVATLVEVNA